MRGGHSNNTITLNLSAAITFFIYKNKVTLNKLVFFMLHDVVCDLYTN